MINDNFVDDLNELNHKIDRLYKNRCHFHQIKRRHESDHIATFFDQRQLIVFKKQIHKRNDCAISKFFKKFVHRRKQIRISNDNSIHF